MKSIKICHTCWKVSPSEAETGHCFSLSLNQTYFISLLTICNWYELGNGLMENIIWLSMRNYNSIYVFACCFLFECWFSSLHTHFGSSRNHFLHLCLRGQQMLQSIYSKWCAVVYVTFYKILSTCFLYIYDCTLLHSCKGVSFMLLCNTQMNQEAALKCNRW